METKASPLLGSKGLKQIMVDGVHVWLRTASAVLLSLGAARPRELLCAFSRVPWLTWLRCEAVVRTTVASS